MKAQALGEALLLDIALEARAHRGQIETATRDVRMRAGDFYRQATLRCADVDDRSVPMPGEFCHEGRCYNPRSAGHSFGKRFESRLIGRIR